MSDVLCVYVLVLGNYREILVHLYLTRNYMINTSFTSFGLQYNCLLMVVFYVRLFRCRFGEPVRFNRFA